MSVNKKITIKKPRGRPAHVPSDKNKDTVKRYAAVGVPVKDIAHKLRIDKETLYKYYFEELQDGRIDANANIGGVLYKQAMSGNTSAAIFWAKTQMQWAETIKNEISGPDGGAVQLSEVKARFLAGLQSNEESDE